MKKIERSLEGLVRIAVRFAVGLGTAFALLCAVVIVSTDLGPGMPAVRPVDVVRLDPVVVTIDAARFDALRAELLQQPSTLARVPDDVAPG